LDFSDECIYYSGDEVLAAFLKKDKIGKLDFSNPLHFAKKQFNKIEEKQVGATLIHYPWELVNQNSAQIIADFNLLGQGGDISGQIYESVVLLNKQNIHVGTNAKIKPGVVLDAESGPVYISNNVTIMPNSVIEGPAFIGHSTIIKMAAKIYQSVSIGEVCKIGGEVEETIIDSYSNKQHEGFLGHAYLGQWVNLGADTNNSDLKNNYGSVKVHINGALIDSGSTFVGLFMGDHSKSGINTMFNTGTTVGVMSNVFGAGFPPKQIPSFSWGGSDGLVGHDIEKALDTARKVMARRKVQMTGAQESVFRKIKQK
jgi:UDP-N-acetylglucosamine diphosphorylase/glucosamine-1-phosphate N-acetyltransferase